MQLYTNIATANVNGKELSIILDGGMYKVRSRPVNQKTGKGWQAVKTLLTTDSKGKAYAAWLKAAKS
jgi:hypothetical protein